MENDLGISILISFESLPAIIRPMLGTEPIRLEESLIDGFPQVLKRFFGMLNGA
jgi:hypothetical protein